MDEVVNFLNDTNKEIVSFIEQYVSIVFTKTDCDNYYSQMHKNEEGLPVRAEIFYKEPMEQAKFAHELLHMKADLMIGDDLIVYEIAMSDKKLSKIIDKRFCEDLLNVTQHIAFAPDIEEMGFGMEQFENETISSLVESIYRDTLNTKLKFLGIYDSIRVQNYLKLLLMFMFFPDEKRFAKEVKALKSIDFILYSRVRELHYAFKNVELSKDSYDYIQEQYKFFVEGVQKWVHTHIK